MNFLAARSVSFPMLEGVLRDVRYACRSFLRAPLAAVTIVVTVGLGLGLVAVVFTILNAFVFREAEVRNPHELFAVTRPPTPNAEPATFTRAQYDALLRETRVFSAAFASTGDIDAWVEGSRLEGPLVTGNYFHVLGVSALRGRTFTPSDDQPGGLPVIVLSHRAWSLHFAGDPDVINRAIRVNGTSFHVIGVMPETFRGLAALAAPDFWAPLSVLGQLQPGDRGREESVGLHIIGRLKPDLSPGQALAQLLVWDSQAAAAGLGERSARDRSITRPPTSLVLEPRAGNVPLSAGVMQMFLPLFFAFGLILVIGCANVANLLLARAVARQREIGIRLAIGASRRRLIQQLLTESLLLALVSAAVAFGISRLALATVVHAVTSTFPPDIGNLRLVVPPADWRVAVFLVAGAVVSTVFFALAPAFQATRLELVRAIRGEVMRDGRPSGARNALVVLQVTGSVLLLICAAVFLRSSWAAARIDLGVRTAGILNVTVLNEEKRGTILDVIKSEPWVASVAATSPNWLGGHTGFAEASSGTGKLRVTYQFVSPEYFGVFDVNLLRGRGFTQAERSASAAVAVVSDSVAREVWPGVDPVGQALRVDPDPLAPSGVEGTAKPDDPPLLSRTVVVVGVARDVEGLRLADIKLGGAGVYMPTSAESAKTSLSLRVRGDQERARQALIDRLAAIDPNMGEVSSLETIVRAGEYLFGIPFWVTLALGVLALLLTLSGLFSVLSYLVEQRTREIGVRMALGATSRSVGTLVLLQSVRPVGIGMALGVCLTAGIGAALLATPAAGLIGSFVRLFDPVAYAASLLCILAACACASLIPALRAARINPVEALRQN
jgi:predicted permease